MRGASFLVNSTHIMNLHNKFIYVIHVLQFNARWQIVVLRGMHLVSLVKSNVQSVNMQSSANIANCAKNMNKQAVWRVEWKTALIIYGQVGQLGQFSTHSSI